MLVSMAVPIPGRASSKSAGGSGDVQKQKSNGKGNGQPAIAPLPKESTRPGPQDTEKPDAGNADNSVSVSKLPTVSIGKDWADWSYWGFGGMLVIVGGSQVWFLYRTLKAIQTQAGHMERQTKALEDSVAAAQKAADAAIAQVEMVKSKERAQLRIEFFPPDFLYKREIGGYEIRLTVFNDGATRAYILDDSIVAYISDQQKTRTGWAVIGLPRNFLPESSPFGTQTAIRREEIVFDNEADSARIALARAGKMTLFINGRIWYRDIFQDEWMLEIDRYWDSEVGSWGPVGSGRNDTHRKVDTSYRDKALEPN